MRDVLPQMQRWTAEGKPFAIARVIRTWGSAPRGVGSAMLVAPEMAVAGSVSGGCIEGEVIEAAIKVIETGKPRRLDFGVSDELAWSVGLSCGGQVSVWVALFPLFSADSTERLAGKQLLEALQSNQPVVWVTRMEPEAPEQYLFFPESSEPQAPELPAPLVASAREAYRKRESGLQEIGGHLYFFHVLPRRARLIVVGAGHITIPLVQMARILDFEVFIIDPRQVFASPDRFPTPPDHLISRWPQEVLPNLKPDEDTYTVLLTHDPKIDDPALHLLLRSPVAYIGALGSRKTHQKRIQRLEAAGFSRETIERIHGPAGLDIHAQTPEEIALSILAQIVQVRHQNRLSR